MDNRDNDPVRNRPSDKGTHNDPYSRDESAQQPGVNTMSESVNDDAKNHLTKTSGAGGDLGPDWGADADKAFDEISPKDDDLTWKEKMNRKS